MNKYPSYDNPTTEKLDGIQEGLYYLVVFISFIIAFWLSIESFNNGCKVYSSDFRVSGDFAFYSPKESFYHSAACLVGEVCLLVGVIYEMFKHRRKRALLFCVAIWISLFVFVLLYHMLTGWAEFSV